MPVRTAGVFIGLVLMISGWLLGLAALVLLSGLAGRAFFTLAGLLVELAGLTVFALRSGPPLQPRPPELHGGRR